MKVVKVTEGSLTTHGITFLKGTEHEVTKKVYDYLKATFGKHFTFEELKETSVTVEDKTETKKTTRTRKTAK